MTTTQAVMAFKDAHTKRMYDFWVKDSRVKSIAIERATPAATRLVKETVARVLADLSVRTDTLAIGRPGRVARCKIEADLLRKADISENFFCALVQRGLRNIREVRAVDARLLPVNEDGYLTFVYEP
jgi:hypothetical protein